MANSILTINMVTRKALAILHQKLNFIGSINRQYDNSFADHGAKIGSALRIRLPNQYVIRNGPVLQAQDTTENQVTLNVTSQKGVDTNFTTTDLTLSMDDFSARVLEPAMAVLAANVEADALNMYAQVYNQVNGMGSPQTFKNFLAGRKILVDNLTPPDADRMVRMNTQDNVDLTDSLKTLFTPTSALGKQYSDGVIGTMAGFELAENTMIPIQTRGAANTGYVLTAVPATGATTMAVGTGTGAANVGDVFVMPGVFRVHPETKNNTGVLQQFVVTAAYAGGTGTISFSPALNYAATGVQNISNAPTSTNAVTFAGTASTNYGISLAYHKNAFTFATADLIDVSMAGAQCSRQVYDGISLRWARQYDINNDRMPGRFDILYGYQAIRPQLACRLAAN